MSGFWRTALGVFSAILLALAFTIWPYALVCLGFHPESVDAAGFWAPLLGLFCAGVIGGAQAQAKGDRKAWLAGLYPALVVVVIWLVVWCYLTGRYSPAAWWQESIRLLSWHHFSEWTLALLAGLLGSLAGTVISGRSWVRLLTAMFFSLALLTAATWASSHSWSSPSKTDFGLTVGPADQEGTVIRFFTFDFEKRPGLRIGLYDADSDDASPYDDANTTYMGQGVDLVAETIARASRASGRHLLCAFNSGFFGSKDSRVAIHEAPIVSETAARYNVDLIRPKDQAWTFAIHSSDSVRQGKPRFTLQPEIPWESLASYQTVLAGVRPLRVAGRSVTLAPGIGSTRLRCSRTSIGWSEDGRTFCVLIVRDPDTEGSSNLQRRANKRQTGGWDVREVQAFWENKGIPNAVLLDGGESTQAAYRDAAGSLILLRAGYHAGIPLGQVNSRPLVAFPAMLPRLQNSRGVLNYLYLDETP